MLAVDVSAIVTMSMTMDKLRLGYTQRLGIWQFVTIRKHVNNLSVTLATDIAIECMTHNNNNYWN